MGPIFLHPKTKEAARDAHRSANDQTARLLDHGLWGLSVHDYDILRRMFLT